MLVIAPGVAHAATGDIRAPFTLGETWSIYQGYDSSWSHHDNQEWPSRYGLDLTYGGTNSSSSGKTVKAPVSGTIQGNPSTSGAGSMCINMADGRSLTVTHINTSITGGAVTAGQTVGTVAAAGTKMNNGVAHVHLQMWDSPGCWGTGNGGIPFDDAHNARICGETNLTASGPGTHGTWSGTQITSYTCGSPPPPPPADTDSDGVPDAQDLCPNNSGAGTTSGCPAHRAIEQNGDFNNDGFGDTIVYYKRGDGGTNVWVYPGSASGVGEPVNRAALAGTPWTNVKAGGVGDVNGDGFDDAVMLYERQADGYTNVWTFSGSASGLQVPVFQRTQDMQWEKITSGGVADFNGDNYGDLLVYYKRGDGGTNVWVFPGNSSGVGEPVNRAALADWPWANIKAGGVGDVNGDGYDDMTMLYERQADGYTNIWMFPGAVSGLQAPVFQRTQDMQWEKLLVGGVADFNNDGYGDMAVYYRRGDGGTNVWVYPGSASGVGEPVVRSVLVSWPWLNVKAGGVGDVNGDGYDDMTMLYERQADGYTNVWMFPGGASSLQEPVFQRTQDMQWEKLLW